MPQLQWLGDIERETSGGYLAKALGGGISTGLQTYVGMKEKRIEQAEEKRKALASEEMDKKKLELMQQQSDADVIKDMTGTMKRIPIDKQPQAWLLMKDFFKARGRPMDTVIDQLSQIPITPDTDLDVGIFKAMFGEERGGGAGEPRDWSDVSVVGRIKAAATPSATKEERALGGLRPGGIFRPPKAKRFPEDITEEEIAYTMKKHGLTRRQLLDKIGR